MAKNAHDIVQYCEKVTQKTMKTAATSGFPRITLDNNVRETIMLDEYRSMVKTLFFT